MEAKQVRVSRNAARTAWLVWSGIVPGTVGALVIENICRTRAEALAWCAAHDFVVAQ